MFDLADLAVAAKAFPHVRLELPANGPVTITGGYIKYKDSDRVLFHIPGADGPIELDSINGAVIALRMAALLMESNKPGGEKAKEVVVPDSEPAKPARAPRRRRVADAPPAEPVIPEMPPQHSRFADRASGSGSGSKGGNSRPPFTASSPILGRV